MLSDYFIRLRTGMHRVNITRVRRPGAKRRTAPDFPAKADTRLCGGCDGKTGGRFDFPDLRCYIL